jgi:CHAT domain-containing protein
MLISTHGEFPEDDALDMQRILLAASSEHDGSLHAEEIRALDLRAARLITLSVCNGSLYRFGPGDEPYGLLPAFLVAGAENVISTFWAIEDDIGRLFMEAFYGHLASGDGPAEALRQSGREFRADGALTRQWSAFSCVGPGRPFPFGP